MYIFYDYELQMILIACILLVLETIFRFKEQRNELNKKLVLKRTIIGLLIISASTLRYSLYVNQEFASFKDYVTSFSFLFGYYFSLMTVYTQNIVLISTEKKMSLKSFWIILSISTILQIVVFFPFAIYGSAILNEVALVFNVLILVLLIVSELIFRMNEKNNFPSPNFIRIRSIVGLVLCCIPYLLFSIGLVATRTFFSTLIYHLLSISISCIPGLLFIQNLVWPKSRNKNRLKSFWIILMVLSVVIIGIGILFFIAFSALGQILGGFKGIFPWI